jgi:hypothetical protein
MLRSLRVGLTRARPPTPALYRLHPEPRRARVLASVGDAYDKALAASFVDSFKTELNWDRVWRTRDQLVADRYLRRKRDTGGVPVPRRLGAAIDNPALHAAFAAARSITRALTRRAGELGRIDSTASKERHMPLTHRTALKHTLAAAVAASALAASPAPAKPIDYAPADSGHPSAAPTRSLAGTAEKPSQDLRGERARDAARAPAPHPGQPVFPTNTQPPPAPATPVKPSGDGDDGDGIWVVLGLGLVGTALAAGGAVGVARHVRVRARRVAV